MTIVELPIILHKSKSTSADAMFEELGIPSDDERIIRRSGIDLERVSLFYEDVETPTTVLVFDSETRVEVAMKYDEFLPIFKSVFEAEECETEEVETDETAKDS